MCFTDCKKHLKSNSIFTASDYSNAVNIGCALFLRFAYVHFFHNPLINSRIRPSGGQANEAQQTIIAINNVPMF